MNLLRQGSFHVFDHAVIVGLAEQVSEEKARNVDALVGIRVTVIGGNAFAGGPEHFAHHVSQKACLFVVHFFATDLRKEFFGQDVLNVALFL